MGAHFDNYDRLEDERYPRQQEFVAKVKASNKALEKEARNEFRSVQLFLPMELYKKLQDMKNRGVPDYLSLQDLWNTVQDEIPQPLNLVVGMEYEYPPKDNGRVNRYKIVNIGTEFAVIRRMNENRAGGWGSKLITRVESIEDHLRSGLAKLVFPDDEMLTQTEGPF